VLCFSVIDRNSFESLKKNYLPELKQNAPNVPILLVGTQSDSRNNDDLVKMLKLNKMDPVTTKEAIYLINYKEPDITSKEEVDDVIITCVEHYLSTHKSKKFKGFEKWKEWFNRE
jgi:GTPase SAR1 family protein